jgi:predicted helicase
LQEYDSTERKKMGVFYTPIPVVQFIVRSVDDILKKEFNLPQGLADTAKIEMEVAVQAIDGRTKDGIKKIKQQFHKVQILDPATGTGTFLNETILHIKKSFAGQEGRWNNYVSADLLPRLHGFELMMASYTIAHLKLSTTIMESGADIGNGRLGVYLTNTLEETKNFDNTLFAGLGLDKAITEESRLANKVKKDLPIMVIMGNPPYNVSSQNKGEYISELLKEYKKDLNERKINLDDDYIKFIRFSESLIEKNGSGIIGMITNNSYIDGITHRQMRRHLLETFDSIYVLDLHGNAKKKEKDENVFNIMQGVSIVLLVKKNADKKGLGKVYHAELFGKREEKFVELNKIDSDKIKWQELKYQEPYYFFVPKDFGAEEEYKNGFSVNDLFIVSSNGIETQKDDVNIFFDKKNADNVLNDFQAMQEIDIVQKYNLTDGRDWKVKTAKADLILKPILTNEIQYRPFDARFINYTGTTKGIVSYPRFEVMKHLIFKNLGLIYKRGFSEDNSAPIFVSKKIIDRRSWTRSGMQGAETIAPIYLYSDDGIKIPNLKKEIVVEIEKITGNVSPENILDYIYAVLHSPSYREKYKEFLKIDFPRVPYPKNAKHFFALVKLGEELRHLHLFEHPALAKLITTYSEAGDDVVEKVVYQEQDQKVFINKIQYFGSVPAVAWEFYIGGYQPAQKWLKDRKARKLSNSDIEHYQKIIIALVESDRIM